MSTTKLKPNDHRESMNDELAKVLKLYREKSHNWDIHKTPEIFIQPTSSPADIKLWLKAKGFSEHVSLLFQDTPDRRLLYFLYFFVCESAVGH